MCSSTKIPVSFSGESIYNRLAGTAHPEGRRDKYIFPRGHHTTHPTPSAYVRTDHLLQQTADGLLVPSTSAKKVRTEPRTAGNLEPVLQYNIFGSRNTFLHYAWKLVLQYIRTPNRSISHRCVGWPPLVVPFLERLNVELPGGTRTHNPKPQTLNPTRKESERLGEVCVIAVCASPSPRSLDLNLFARTTRLRGMSNEGERDAKRAMPQRFNMLFIRVSI